MRTFMAGIFLVFAFTMNFSVYAVERHDIGPTLAYEGNHTIDDVDDGGGLEDGTETGGHDSGFDPMGFIYLAIIGGWGLLSYYLPKLFVKNNEGKAERAMRIIGLSPLCIGLVWVIVGSLIDSLRDGLGIFVSVIIYIVLTSIILALEAKQTKEKEERIEERQRRDRLMRAEEYNDYYGYNNREEE